MQCKIDVSTMNTILSDRLKELGLTKYEVAKRLAKSEGKNPQQIATRVAQTINEPENRKYCNVVNVIHALGGEIVIRWTNVDERIAS